MCYLSVHVCRAKSEEQKQREVEIVEKILNEEKALATRKKLHRHLFVDRQKEIVKVTISSLSFHFILPIFVCYNIYLFHSIHYLLASAKNDICRKLVFVLFPFFLSAQ